MIAGLFLKGNEVRIVNLNGTREQHELVADKLNKIAIPKAPTQADIAIFCETLLAYCERHAIEQIVVNRRATTGQGAGGAGTFILEGVMLAVVKVPLSFVHPATLRASDKKYSDLKLAKPTTVDLGKAYDLAFEALT